MRICEYASVVVVEKESETKAKGIKQMLKIAAEYIGNDRANVKRNVDYRSKKV